jgi:F0F1-type ATP synthase membrane subunit a
MQNEIELYGQNARGLISCSFTPHNLLSNSGGFKLSQCDQIIFSFYLYDLAICIWYFLIEKAELDSVDSWKTVSQEIIKGYNSIIELVEHDTRFLYWSILFTLISFILQANAKTPKDDENSNSENSLFKIKCLTLFEKLFEMNESFF